jgi:hypothetical protein
MATARSYTRGEREGETTKLIESYTAQVPSGAYLTLAIGSMALSLIMMLSGRRNAANFIGQWAPTLLIIGLYNKLVKVEGSD